MPVSHTFARTKSSTAFGLLDSDKTRFIFPIKDYVKISENEPVTSFFFIIVTKGLHDQLSFRVFWFPNRYRFVLWVSSLKSNQNPHQTLAFWLLLNTFSTSTRLLIY